MTTWTSIPPSNWQHEHHQLEKNLAPTRADFRPPDQRHDVWKEPQRGPQRTRVASPWDFFLSSFSNSYLDYSCCSTCIEWFKRIDTARLGSDFFWDAIYRILYLSLSSLHVERYYEILPSSASALTTVCFIIKLSAFLHKKYKTTFFRFFLFALQFSCWKKLRKRSKQKIETKYGLKIHW